jgi:hypothetical protein
MKLRFLYGDVDINADIQISGQDWVSSRLNHVYSLSKPLPKIDRIFCRSPCRHLYFAFWRIRPLFWSPNKISC